jgi:hypothetical protein
MIDKTDSKVTTISVKGKKLVAGLYWQSLRKPRAYMKEAKEIGKRESMDIVAIRRAPTILQAGFVSKSAGVDKGMYSFASVVAEHFSQLNADSTAEGKPFIAVFDLNNGEFAMVAVKDGAILPDSDLVGDYKTVLVKLREYYARIQDETAIVYAPEKMEYGGEEIALETVLSSLSRKHTLRPLNMGGLTVREVAAISVGVLTVVALISVFFTWRHRVAEEERRVEALRAAERARIALESGRQSTPMALEHPWARIPAMPVVLNNCQAAIHGFPLSAANWMFVRAGCTPAGVEVGYARAPGRTINEFRSLAETVWPGSVITFSDNGDSAYINLSHTLPAGGDDEMEDLQLRVDALTSHFQYRQTPVTLSAKTFARPEPLPGAVAEDTPLPDWKTVEFAVSSPRTPSSLIAGVNPIGLRLLSMEATLQGTALTWTLKGEIYGR